MAANFIGLDPIRALYWSAVVNGMVATPLLAIMTWIAAQPRIMGGFAIWLRLRIGGWVATIVLASCVIAKRLTAVMQLGD